MNKTSTSIANIWEHSSIAHTHPYLKNKAIKAHYAKVGQNGDLLLPLNDKDSIIKNLQVVDTAGNKSFLGDGDLCGWHLKIGEPKDGTIVLCEDYATGATIFECTSICTVVCYRLDNMELVAKIITEKYPNTEIIIAADDDNQTAGSPKKTQAYALAQSIKARFIAPDFGPDRPSNVKDFNDLAIVSGAAAVSDAFRYLDEIPIAGPREFSFDHFALNGLSSEMKQQMLEDKFVLAPLALLGQSTVFYASPNAGKTLITLKLLRDAIVSREIDAENVYYINADDNFKGLTTKLEFAEKYGFKMLAPNHKGFESSKFFDYIRTLIESDKCRGMIIIIDTLKKFVDLMQKSNAREIGILIRDFTGKGGTIIALAHVNKHKDANGRSVYQGTTDVPDDVDCTYTIEVGDSPKNIKRVSFFNHKNRGDVAKEASFEYSTEKLPYIELIDSVKTISEAEAIALREIEQRNNLLASNKEIIDSVISYIMEGVTNKTQLIKAVAKATINSDAKVKAVLDKHTGKDYAAGDRWNFEVGAKNTHTYYLTNDINAYKNIK